MKATMHCLPLAELWLLSLSDRFIIGFQACILTPGSATIAASRELYQDVLERLVEDINHRLSAVIK
jgi:hypothetical protein